MSEMKLTSGLSRISEMGEGQCQHQKARQPIILQNVRRKLHENEENWTGEGRAHVPEFSHVDLDPPQLTVKITLPVSKNEDCARFFDSTVLREYSRTKETASEFILASPKPAVCHSAQAHCSI